MQFFHKDIVVEVPNSVYFPREDSLTLAEIIEKISTNGKNVLDMGCGSGFLAILMARNKAIVTAADINPEAIAIAEKNAAINGINITVIHSNLFENIRDKFDLIVFNPPYLPFGPYDLQWSGGIDIIERFLKDAKSHLKEHGKIIFLASTLTAQEKEITALIEKNGYKYAVLTRKKVPWEELVVFEAKL